MIITVKINKIYVDKHIIIILCKCTVIIIIMSAYNGNTIWYNNIIVINISVV